jgi:hypothetical protein
MSIKLGTTTASLYLGSTPVAAYLGAEQVHSAGATLYFDGAVDGEWTTVGNWWLDDEHTEPAGRLPASTDSVIASENINASGQTVVNFTLNDTEFFNMELDGSITVTGSATFVGGSSNFATVTGNATFNDSSVNSLGTVNGDATFNDSAFNYGSVTGNATFSGSAEHRGDVTGTATFTGSAVNCDGTAGTFVPDPPPSC